MTKTICLFNHKGGVSKTTTTFNLGWSLAEKGKKVFIVDLDSQCNLTGLVMGYNAVADESMEAFYNSRENLTMRPLVAALMNGMPPDEFARSEKGRPLAAGQPNLWLLPGHLDTADLDAQISVALKIATGIPATRTIPGNLPKMLQTLAREQGFDYMVYDLSPNVGGLNEVILMSSDYFIVPTTPDFFCLQAVRSLVKNIAKWHREITRFREDNHFEEQTYAIKNRPLFLGAVQQRYRPRYEKPAMSFQKWIDIIRETINQTFVPELEKIGCVMEKAKVDNVLSGTGLQAYDLAHIADFNSLIAMSQQIAKPVFALTDDDIAHTGKVYGIVKGNMIASRDAFREVFSQLADRILALTD